MFVYRLHRIVRVAHDHTGAMLAGGRWNSIGTPMLYTAEHLSLACLEVLVHLDRSLIPLDYAWSAADIGQMPQQLVKITPYSIMECQSVGDSWLRTGEQLAVRVPSAIIPTEFNILLNPVHPEYARIRWSRPELFRFDPRLFSVEPEML